MNTHPLVFRNTLRNVRALRKDPAGNRKKHSQQGVQAHNHDLDNGGVVWTLGPFAGGIRSHCSGTANIRLSINENNTGVRRGVAYQGCASCEFFPKKNEYP